MSDELMMQLQQLGISQSDLDMAQTVMGMLVVISLISLLLTPWLARRKRLNVAYWALMALLFGPFALLVILFVPSRSDSTGSVV